MISKTVKTPLRYPGGKSRHVKKILPIILTRLGDVYIEPFVGGGSIALAVSHASPGTQVIVNDKNPALSNFWRHLRDNADHMVHSLCKIKSRHSCRDSAGDLFRKISDKGSDHLSCGISGAVDFYCLNKLSFSGLTEGSSYSAQASEQNWSYSGFANLLNVSRYIKRWIILNEDYRNVPVGGFIYFDPPYLIKDGLYGKNGEHHHGFDHQGFARYTDSIDSDVLISYNASDDVRGLFSGKWVSSEYSHTYTMRSTGDYMESQKGRNELLLRNFE